MTSLRHAGGAPSGGRNGAAPSDGASPVGEVLVGMLLVVDGSDVCRAPMLSFLLGSRLADTCAPVSAVISRGLEAEEGRTMCESASARLGFTGPALAHFGAHRAHRLSRDDLASAALVLTAERAQRSAVVRALPGTQAKVFTLREALALAAAVVQRRGLAEEMQDLAGIARLLHGARGTVPLIEPATRTGPFHWRRASRADPLTIAAGHDGGAEHRSVARQAHEVGVQLADRLATLAGSVQEQVPRSA